MDSNSKYHQPGKRGLEENLLCLLGLDGHRRILIIGDSLAHWCSVFPQSHFVENCESLADSGITYDLIFYHSCSASNWKNFQADLGRLLSLIAESGWIFFFAENFFSPINLKRSRPSLNSLIHKYQFYPKSLRRAIEKTGLNVVDDFLGVPAFDKAEELVSPTSKFFELPTSVHPLLRLAGRLGCYPALADGMIILAGPHKLENCGLIRTVGKSIRKFSGGKAHYILERFEIRLRGTLILFLTEQSMRKSFICRIISDSVIESVVRRNQDFLNFLHHTLSNRFLLNKLPIPIFELSYKKRTVFVESLIEGVPAWKINNAQKRAVIFQGAHNFITAFHLTTRSPRQSGIIPIEKILEQDLRRLNDCPAVTADLLTKLQFFADKLFHLKPEKEFYLSATHGDYGYGNILVKPNTGLLTGVIDWDTGRIDDLPGIDYLNLLVQKCRSEKSCGLNQAFTTICQKVLRRGELDEQGFYSDEFNLVDKQLKIILYSGLIRYMSRAAQYPEVFAGEQNDYKESLSFLEKFVSL